MVLVITEVQWILICADVFFKTRKAPAPFEEAFKALLGSREVFFCNLV